MLNSISSPMFPLDAMVWSCICCLVHQLFLPSFCFCRARGWILSEKDTGGKFILDGLPVRAVLFGQREWVVQCNEPNLAALGSLSNFLFDCTPPLSSLSSAFAHSLDLLKPVKAFTGTKVTADFKSNHIKLTTRGAPLSPQR